MDKSKGLHPRNIHRQGYDFEALVKSLPELSNFVIRNQYDVLAVDYSNPSAVLCLNQALILNHYQVHNWSVPKGHLCPPIPGRADYIHYIADILSEEFQGDIPVGKKIKGLDIGIGTSCIYPILGNSIYGWKFVGSDISSETINHASSILHKNPKLKKNIKLRFQELDSHIFKGLIKFGEYFHFTICNPPFYSSMCEAKKASAQKVKKLNLNKEKKGHATNKKKTSNFGGVEAELWCAGGELAFIKKMIKESHEYKEQCLWFTTLVSNKKNLKDLYNSLATIAQTEVRTIEMTQGKKITHILAWRFN